MSSADRVLDAWALVAWQQREASAPRVRSLLARAATGALQLSISVVNAGEVFYQLARKRDMAAADRFWFELVRGQIPIRLMPASVQRVARAARLKATYQLSYADAFAVGLAQELQVPVVTGDPEIRGAAAAGAVGLEWIGP